MGMGMGTGTELVSLLLLLPILLLLLFSSVLGTSSSSSSSSNYSFSSSSSDHIERGFSARPEPWSSSSVEFQSVLTDSTSTFSLGFLRCGGGGGGDSSDHDLLDLAVIHLPSSFPLWRAAPSQPCSFSWSTSTALLFNGSLTLVDSSHSWSTNDTSPHGHGDRLTLLSSSNLQITSSSTSSRSSSSLSLICWQSFDFPSDSIIQNQNFTSHSQLLSHNQQYSMKLGANFLALYFYAAADHGRMGIMYWKRTAMEAKAQIVDGRGPIYARLDPTGFLGLYQTEHALVDLLSFDTFNAGTRKTLRRLTLESDGNLRAYYYYSSNASSSEWVPDFAAISSADRCSLPAACGAYGVCHMGGGGGGGGGNARCGCLDNRTATEGCYPADSGDLCGSSGGFGVVRRRGVELANKLEWLERRSLTSSLEECEGWCERNCSCWGALYSNTSGYCYRMDYPIHTVLAVGDQRKIGYFKVRNNLILTTTSTTGREKDERRRRRARSVMVVVVVLGMLILVCGFAGFRVWRMNSSNWRRRRNGGEVDGAVPEGGMSSSSSSSSYKPLISTTSFRHIELTNSSGKE